jgi:hypothetical protein
MSAKSRSLKEAMRKNYARTIPLPGPTYPSEIFETPDLTSPAKIKGSKASTPPIGPKE